jgi:hypothetical protein
MFLAMDRFSAFSSVLNKSSLFFFTQSCFEGGPSSVWQLDREKKSDAAVEYFALADLWEHYAESSANGLAVPVRHLGHAGESTVVTQHFVPYLSAVQLYTATRPTVSLAIPR